MIALPTIGVAALARSRWLQWAAGVFIFSLASIFLVLWMPATT